MHSEVLVDPDEPCRCYVKSERRIRRSSLSPARGSSAPPSPCGRARPGRLTPPRSIRDPDLIHRFFGRSRGPAPGVVASLLFLISSSPSRASFCATFGSPIAHTVLTQPSASDPWPPPLAGPLPSSHSL